MGEWLDWSTACKAVPIAITAIGTLRSWRNQWKGPRGFFEFCDRHIRPEAEIVRLRYENFRLLKDNRFLTSQLAERDKQVDHLVTQITEGSQTASLLESSVASVAREIASRPSPPQLTTSSRPRLRRQKPSLPTLKK